MKYIIRPNATQNVALGEIMDPLSTRDVMKMKFGMRSLRRPQRDISLSTIVQDEVQLRLLEALAGNKHLINWPIHISTRSHDEQTLYIIDSETNGIPIEHCDIIELGAIKVRYSPSLKKLTSVEDMVSCYEAPKEKLANEVIEITGISNTMLKGKEFDDEYISNWFAEPGIFLTNSKKHEQAFFEKRFPQLAGRTWLCLIEDINWRDYGVRQIHLSALLSDLGWHHRHAFTYMDCFAIAYLLTKKQDVFESLCDTIASGIRHTKSAG